MKEKRERNSLVLNIPGLENSVAAGVGRKLIALGASWKR
jgi:hypothetical protein